MSSEQILFFIVFHDGTDYNGIVDANGPCADYKPGEDDLEAFDFIRKFRFANNNYSVTTLN